jgi:glycosyltransferase involved in cell wall biosynthesis
LSVRVVVPCFDEAERLDTEAFADLAQHVDEVIFVDDGSTDGTAAVVRRLMAERPGRVDVIVLPENVGKAEAVRIGLLDAIERGSAVVGYLDADLATPASEMLRLIEIADQQPRRTAVLGSRVALLGHTVRRRPVRHYLGRLYATAASLALGVAVYDTQCGAKVFRVGTPLQLALADPFPDRWSFDVELLGRLLADPRQHADPVLEVPLREWRDVSGSSVGVASGARALWALTGLRRRIRRHRRRYG